MKRIAAIVFWAGAAWGETFTGVVTDTMCGARHGMTKAPDDQCIRMCVKGQFAWALWDGESVWRLSDQKTSARYAARKVKVPGTRDGKAKTIRVSAIEAVE